MRLNEPIVEDAALAMPMAALTPTLSHGEREGDGEVVLVGRLREALRRLNPAIPSRTLATLRDTLLPKLLNGELSVAWGDINRTTLLTTLAAAESKGRQVCGETLPIEN